jgi:hypothetical protein
MVALPAACIRSPVPLAVVGLLILVMFALFAVIVIGAPGVRIVAVVLAALTALKLPAPASMLTMTPGSSVRFMVVLLVL